jgi:hypothetical protein
MWVELRSCASLDLRWMTVLPSHASALALGDGLVAVGAGASLLCFRPPALQPIWSANERVSALVVTPHAIVSLTALHTAVVGRDLVSGLPLWRVDSAPASCGQLVPVALGAAVLLLDMEAHDVVAFCTQTGEMLYSRHIAGHVDWAEASGGRLVLWAHARHDVATRVEVLAVE